MHHLLPRLCGNILITGNNHAINTLIQNLNKEFAFNDLEQLNYFLGKQVSPLPNEGLHLSQKKYITELLTRAKMQNA